MKQRIVIVTICIVAMCLLLVGCKNRTDKTDNNSGSDVVTTETTAETTNDTTVSTTNKFSSGIELPDDIF